MPKVTEEHRAARRHQIAEAALRCFARSGFQQTSMADIIAESGLSAGAIYGHYKSKEELVELAVTEVLDQRFLDLDASRRSNPHPSPAHVVGLLVRGLTEQIGDLQLLLQIWGQVPINPALARLTTKIGGRIRSTFADYLASWYREERGMTADDAERAAREDASLYLGLVQGYVVQTVLFSDFDGSAYLAAVERADPRPRSIVPEAG